MRITSATYRGWSVAQWCDHVQSLNIHSLTEWANISPYAYRQAVALGIHRQVADVAGWSPRVENGALVHMSDAEFAVRFRRLRVGTMTDMWKRQQPWTQFLRSQGRLEDVAAMLGIAYVNEFHPIDVDYYVQRCMDVGYFEAWCQVDRIAAETARRHGLLAEVRNRCPGRPADGFTTRGGRCHSLPELALARLLEYNDEPFLTEPSYPFHLSTRRYHLCRADFQLHRRNGLRVEVWATTQNDTSRRWTRYLARRQDKVQRCAELGLALLEVEGRNLFRLRVEGYLNYLVERLASVGVAITTLPEPRQALALEGPAQKAGDGLGSLGQVDVIDQV